MRMRAHELLDGLTGPVVVQGPRVWDGLAAATADPTRRRLLLTPLRTGGLDGIELGPAQLVAGSPEGLVRLPADVVDVDPHGVALIVDPLLAEFEGRRRHWRLDLSLPVRGQPSHGGAPWHATTLDVSGGGALVDRVLPLGSTHRVVLAVGGTELRVGAAVARSGPPGQTALGFTALSDAAARAVAVTLLRAAARQAA